jgi:hypothetical protein
LASVISDEKALLSDFSSEKGSGLFTLQKDGKRMIKR